MCPPTLAESKVIQLYIIVLSFVSVVSGILSAQHKIGRHVLVVTMASDMEQTKLSEKGESHVCVALPCLFV